MTTLFSRRLVRRLLCGLALAIVSTAALAQTKVRVASKIDTEGSLLGQIVIQLLEEIGRASCRERV